MGVADCYETNMRRDEGTFTSTDSTKLFERAWLPDGAPKAAIAIVHGYAEHSGRYEHVGKRFAAAGYAVYALDLRGHGRSEGERALVRSVDEYVSDAAALLSRVRDRQPGAPLVILGHSMGGLIVALMIAGETHELTCAVLSGPVLRAAGGPARLVELLFRALSRLFPKLPLAKLDSAKVSRDPAVVAAYDGDPLVYRGRIKLGLIGAMMRAVRAMQSKMKDVTLPLLIVHGAEDGLADPEGSRLLHERARSSDKTLRIYDGLYHEIFNEPERDQVLSDVIAWLDERVAVHERAVAGGT